MGSLSGQRAIHRLGRRVIHGGSRSGHCAVRTPRSCGVMTQRRLGDGTSGQVLRVLQPRPPASKAFWAAVRVRVTDSCHKVRTASGSSVRADSHAQSASAAQSTEARALGMARHGAIARTSRHPRMSYSLSPSTLASSTARLSRSFWRNSALINDNRPTCRGARRWRRPKDGAAPREARERGHPVSRGFTGQRRQPRPATTFRAA